MTKLAAVATRAESLTEVEFAQRLGWLLDLIRRLVNVQVVASGTLRAVRVKFANLLIRA